MFMNTSKSTLTLLTLLVLQGCGGSGSDKKTNGNGGQGEGPQVDTAGVYGYWQPNDESLPAYEFFSSPVEEPYTSRLKTGRIITGESVSANFYWDINASGIVTVNSVGNTCSLRPLTRCAVKDTIYMDAVGGSNISTNWNVNIDESSNGSIDDTFSGFYRKNEISFADFNLDNFYLSPRINTAFAMPMSAWIEDDQIFIEIRDERDLDDGSDFQKRVLFSGYNENPRSGNITLGIAGVNEFDITEEFFVLGDSYRDITYIQSYKNAYLTQSLSGEYTLTYELSRELSPPEDVNPEDVVVFDHFEGEVKTIPVVAIDEFVNGISVSPGDVFYGFFRLDFTAIEKSAGELHFISENSGELRIAGIIDEAPQVRRFSWNQEGDGLINLDFADAGMVEIRFMSEIGGGYQVLYSHLREGMETDYRLTDFVEDTGVEVTAENLPGRYQIVGTVPNPNSPSTHNYEIAFYEDGSVGGFFNGYWFIGEDGEIYSYECRDKNTGLLIAGYDACINAFSNLGDYAFAHIRKFSFVHQDGNEYKVKYVSDIYRGGELTGENDYETIALVFRFKRIGDN